MRNRFTRTSRTGRGSIPKRMRHEVYERDGRTCQFCGKSLGAEELTIDHLVPLSLGGLDEMTNWVTACGPCNQRKADQPLAEFATTLDLEVTELPVHGDPIIDNDSLPLQIRLLRKQIFDRSRKGGGFTGKSAQKKLEKAYRREFWQTAIGQELEAEWPSLPGHVRVMVPEIETIAKSPREYLLLVELAKSASTRNLIGSVLKSDSDVFDRLESLRTRSGDAGLVKRIGQAMERFEGKARARGI